MLSSCRLPAATANREPMDGELNPTSMFSSLHSAQLFAHHMSASEQLYHKQRTTTTKMKSIYSTIMAAAMLLLASSLSSTEAFSAVDRINTINKNIHHGAAIVSAPRLDNHNAAHRTRSSTAMQLSATTNSNRRALGPATLRAKANQAVHKIRTLFLHLSTILTHKSKLIVLSTMLSIATLMTPQSAVAKSSFFSLGGSSSRVEEVIVVPTSNNSRSGGKVVRKVGKFVVTIGAIGAGACFANGMKSKFASDSSSEDDEKSGGGEDGKRVKMEIKETSKNNDAAEIKNTNGTGNSVIRPSSSSQQQKKKEGTTANNDKTATEIEPMSEQWIQQQLNDAEKRSNVLNDAIKMTKQPTDTVTATAVATKSNNKGTTTTTKATPPKVNASNSNSNKKVSMGNTIGIIPPPTPSSTTAPPPPLVKNLDSKIEMLQRRDAERSIEQQRINDEQAQVEMEKKKVAIVEAERKMELAEMEYQQSQLQQQQQQVQVVEETKEQYDVVVEEEKTTPPAASSISSPTSTTTAAVAPISIKYGPGGSPAKSRQEDLELTREIILEHVNSMDSMSIGVEDDE